MNASTQTHRMCNYADKSRNGSDDIMNDVLFAAKNAIKLLKNKHRWVRWDDLAAATGIYDHDKLDELMQTTKKLTDLDLEERDGRWRIVPKEKS